MDALKKFLLYHGEKVVLVVVALLCFISGASTLGRFFNSIEIQYSGGDAPYIVQQQELPQMVTAVRQQLTNVNPGLTVDLSQDDLHQVMVGKTANPIPPLTDFADQWVFYNRPPDFNIAWGPTRQTAGQWDPPARFITGVAPPIHWRAFTSPAGVLLIANGPAAANSPNSGGMGSPMGGENDGIRWPLAGEVGILVQRIKVGTVKDDLSFEITKHFMDRASWTGFINVAAMKASTAEPAATPVSAGAGYGVAGAMIGAMGGMSPPPGAMPGRMPRGPGGGMPRYPGAPGMMPGQQPMMPPDEYMPAEPASIMAGAYGSSMGDPYQPSYQDGAATPAGQTAWSAVRGMPANTEFLVGPVAQPTQGESLQPDEQMQDPWLEVEGFEQALDANVTAEYREIRASGLTLGGGWQTIGVMNMYGESFREPDIPEILKTGQLPGTPIPSKLAAAAAAQAAGEAAPDGTGAAADGRTEEAVAEEPSLDGLDDVARMEEILRRRRQQQGQNAASSSSSTAQSNEPPDQRDEYVPRFYAMFDNNNIEENAIYRYRFVTFTKVRDLPPSLRRNLDYTAYNQRAELADGTLRRRNESDQVTTLFPTTDIIRGRMAPTQEEIDVFFEAAAKADDPFSTQPPVELMEWDDKLGTLKQMVRADNTPTKRALAYLNGDNVYSRFSYSSLLIVPPTKRLKIQNVANVTRADGSTARGVRYLVEIPEGTKTVRSRPFIAAPPAEVDQLETMRWVKHDENTPLVNPATGEYVELGVEELYGQLPYLRPVPLGGVGKAQGKDYDFLTNWGLVDMRDGVIEAFRVTMRQGKREVAAEPAQLAMTYVVLRELTGDNPRYKREVISVRGGSLDNYQVGRIIWNPALEEEQAKRRAQRQAAAPTAGTPPEAGVPASMADTAAE